MMMNFDNDKTVFIFNSKKKENLNLILWCFCNVCLVYSSAHTLLLHQSECLLTLFLRCDLNVIAVRENAEMKS